MKSLTRASVITALAIAAAGLGATTLPPLVWPDAPVPASLSAAIPAARHQLTDESADRLPPLPLHLTFLEARCSETGAVALVYPSLMEGFGLPLLEALACGTRVVAARGGVLEEFPNLKFCFFEAGGSWLPWVMYTLDRTYNVERQCARCTTPPSELIRKSSLVAVEPDEACITGAIASIGSGNFIIGSDYPHPPSTYPTTAAGIETMAGLSQQDRDNILGLNFANLLGL